MKLIIQVPLLHHSVESWLGAEKAGLGRALEVASET